MKKFISAVLAAVLFVLCSVGAFAAADSKTADVKGKYIKSSREDVYSVDIAWGAMEFNYNEGKSEWNPSNHKWEQTVAPSWTVNRNSNSITLKNNSSKAVNASFAFAANKGYDKLNGEFKYNGGALSNALALEVPQADVLAKAYTVTFMPNGEIPSSHSTSAYAKMGTITVTLA